MCKRVMLLFALLTPALCLARADTVAITNAATVAVSPAVIVEHEILATHQITMGNAVVADYAFVWTEVQNANLVSNWVLLQLVNIRASHDPSLSHWQVRKIKNQKQLKRFAYPPALHDIHHFLNSWGWRNQSCSFQVRGSIDQAAWHRATGTGTKFGYFENQAHC